jgi:hypothetical protein
MLLPVDFPSAISTSCLTYRCRASRWSAEMIYEPGQNAERKGRAAVRCRRIVSHGFLMLIERCPLSPRWSGRSPQEHWLLSPQTSGQVSLGIRTPAEPGSPPANEAGAGTPVRLLRGLAQGICNRRHRLVGCAIHAAAQSWHVSYHTQEPGRAAVGTDGTIHVGKETAESQSSQC